jgi:hypothetical protein
LVLKEHVVWAREVVEVEYLDPVGAENGSNLGNGGFVDASAEPWSGQPASLWVKLPPLAALLLVPEFQPGGAPAPAPHIH